MKNNIKLIVAMIGCVISTASFGATLVTFEDAMQRGLISYKITTDYVANRSMDLELNNNSNNPINVQLEPGRIFYSSQDIQPYVVTRPSIIALEPHGQEDVMIYARCGNSSARSPGHDTKFSRTSMGAPLLVQALTELSNRRINDNYLAQQVVWHYTNGHSLNTIIADNDKEKEFLKWICKNENVEFPWYQKHYAPSQTGNDMEFSNVPTLIQGEMQVVLTQPSNLQVKLYDQEGKSIKTIYAILNQAAGQCTIPLNINLSDIAKGDYKIVIENDAGVKIDERSVAV
jgi:hypothetical protein